MRDTIQLIFSGNFYNRLVTRPFRIDFGIDNSIVIVGASQRLTRAIKDAALADEVEAAFVANAINGHEVNVVFQGSRRNQILDRGGSAWWPIGGQNDEIGAEKHQTT